MFHKETYESNFYNCTWEQGPAQVAQLVKKTPASVGNVSLIPWWGQSPGEGNGNPLQYSCLGSPHSYSPWDPKGSDTTEQTWTQQFVQRWWLNYLIRWSSTTLWRIICFTQTDLNVNVIQKVYLLSNIQTSDWPYIQAQWSCQVDT